MQGVSLQILNARIAVAPSINWFKRFANTGLSTIFVWNKGLGLLWQGNCNVFVENGDYQPWRANYGRTLPASSGALLGGGGTNVPEPSALALVWMAFVALIATFQSSADLRRRRATRNNFASGCGRKPH